ncbi:uncharacterized protein KIAA1522 [Triplophysa rosa]|uniref:Uncharacterized protein n=1 Tax=Triplophysa rosa TaxID=992332 RepID=A0A9W7WP84_TRIRA|nr:uncharacterized protein KIAA1522 [Triplophysa rosa]KAI7805790.1 hypothetical protein IRJ41_020841 [Triplophysa rosa]
MSSGRESVGDLIPPDMLQVFFEERQGGRGKRGRKRRGSFSRAFKWLKRQRRKARKNTLEIRGGLLDPGSPLALPPATLNPENVSGPHPTLEFQENVFAEGIPPKYVLDLHTEAQQGLKLLQQEDDKNGMDYPDDQSMISTVTTRTDDSMAFSELRGFDSESTAADTISTRSSISMRSTRSGLRRQDSTFRPLKPDKTEKPKSHRKHLKTVAGIPRHVQRELGLDRAAWITTNLDGELPNGAVVLPAIVSTVDGAFTTSEQERIQAHPQDAENTYTGLPTLTKPNNDSLIQRLINNLSAVPLLTIPGNPSENTVMSISPQATYMSKIIPNAVLPPSVDVVALSRNRSRSSVRTVSKSSLVSASPASTRASSRISSHCSTVRSDLSDWSRSDSSETLMSESSTLSSSSTPRVASRVSQVENTNRPCNEKVQNNGSHNDSLQGDTTDAKMESGGAFTRNLSVMKKSKRPPAPPSRSYSLHNGKQIRNASSTKQEFNHKTIISPYSSQSNEKGPTTMLAELKMRKNGASYTNGTSKFIELKKSLLSAKSLMNGRMHSPAVMALWSLLDIPDHPMVMAPPAPPPETWAHNQRTFELLCGPGPVNYARWAKKRGLKIVDPEHPSMPTTGKVKPPPPDTAPPATLWWQIKSPPPPPDIIPPPPASAALRWQANPPPPDTVPPPPAQTAVWWQSKSPSDTVDSTHSPAEGIPPHPLFPPPAPPVGPGSSNSVFVQNDTVIPPPPAFSQLFLRTVPPDIPLPPLQVPPPPPPPPGIPPPPPQEVPLPPPPDIPPPPPPQEVPPPPQEVPPPPDTPPPSPQKVPQPPPQVPLARPPQVHIQQQVPPPTPPPETKKIPQEYKPSPHVILVTSTTSHQTNIPPPPPLPTDIKLEARVVTPEKEEKRSSSPSPAKEENSAPMVTQSLLQMVRLRSVRSNQSPAVNPDKASHPTQKSGVSQDAPPKPLRRSLIMTSLPPDLEALSSTESKPEALSSNGHVNATIASDTQQGSVEPETWSANGDESTQNTTLEPTCSLVTDAISAPEPATEPELKCSTVVEQIQPMPSEPVTIPNTTEPKVEPIINEPKTPLHAEEPYKTPDSSVKQAVTIEIPSKPESEQPKTQTSSSDPPIISPSTPVVHPPANPSMSLQDAIRRKTAANATSKDNQTKRFSLLSPPPVTSGHTAPVSPASTASFIFSKSTKKVVIETPTSPAVQADLRRTLVAELASVSDSPKFIDSHKTASKVPPPVAIKPKSKVESAAQNSAEAERGHAQTETVQTAGQDVQTENSENANK